MKIIPAPLLVLFLAAGIVAALLHFQPQAEKSEAVQPLTNIEVLPVQPEDIPLFITSQGTALPLTESDLAIEVSGRVIAVAEQFRPGGYFKKGDTLLEIDPLNYEVALAARAAALAKAKLSLAQEEALAQQAKNDWKSIGKGQASPLTLRLPQLEFARATVASARAAYESAQADLADTKVRAPYDGRILSKNIDVGQLATPSTVTPAARLYATATAEVRLPISEREAALLPNLNKTPAPVELTKGSRKWHGYITRIEATIDTQSRLLYAVAEIENPFGKPSPMRRGLFLDATIQGRTIKDAYRIPRMALRGSNTVYVVSPDDTLTTRKVHIVMSDPSQVIIDHGLLHGERIAISPIAYYVENMPVNILSHP